MGGGGAHAPPAPLLRTPWAEVGVKFTSNHSQDFFRTKSSSFEATKVLKQLKWALYYSIPTINTIFNVKLMTTLHMIYVQLVMQIQV